MSDEKTGKTSTIAVHVSMDEQNIPSKMEWEASDSGMDKSECKAFMMTVWDPKEESALRIDLWTKEMRVDEMNMFFYQNFATMADTFERATNNKELAEEIRDFAHHFGHRVQIFGEDHKH